TVTRSDGGPTGWEAIIQMPNRAESYREFALELQDLQMAYTKESRPKLGSINSALFTIPPEDFQTGEVAPTSKLYADFLDNGITLSKTDAHYATVEKTSDDSKWVVKDPVNYAYGPNGREVAFYIVADVTDPKAPYKVFTPNLNTWSDPFFAINSPQKEPKKGP